MMQTAPLLTRVAASLLVASAAIAQPVEPVADPPATSEAPAAEAAPAAPVDTAALKAEATEALRGGDCPTAIARFDALAKALEGDEGQTEERLKARLFSGVCHERLDQLEEAATAFRDVVFGGASDGLIEKAEPRLRAIEPLLPVAVTFVCDEKGVNITLEALPDDIKPCADAWKLAAGTYRGAATAPDGREVPFTVRVTPAVPEEVVILMPAAAGRRLITQETPPPPVDDGPDRTLAWVLAGGAAATLVGGVVCNVLARDAVDRGNEAYSRYERARAVYDRTAANAARGDVESARDEADLFSISSYALFGVGLGLAGASTWLFLDDGPEATDSTAIQVVPALGGLGVVGRW